MLIFSMYVIMPLAQFFSTLMSIFKFGLMTPFHFMSAIVSKMFFCLKTFDLNDDTQIINKIMAKSSSLTSLNDFQANLSRCRTAPSSTSPPTPSRCQFNQHFTDSFYTHRSRKGKKDSQVVSFFALLGSACIKTARKMFLKLTTGQLRSRLQRRASATVYLGRLQGSSGHGIYVGRKPDCLFTILHGVRPRSREQLCRRIGKHIQLWTSDSNPGVHVEVAGKTDPSHRKGTRTR